MIGFCWFSNLVVYPFHIPYIGFSIKAESRKGDPYLQVQCALMSAPLPNPSEMALFLIHVMLQYHYWGSAQADIMGIRSSVPQWYFGTTTLLTGCEGTSASHEWSHLRGGPRFGTLPRVSLYPVFTVRHYTKTHDSGTASSHVCFPPSSPSLPRTLSWVMTVI